MPYSFVEIEESKSRTIEWSVGFLLLLYIAGALLIVGVVKYLMFTPHGDTVYRVMPPFWSVFDVMTVVWTLSGALLVSGIHWAVATNAMIDTTLGYMDARIADRARDDERMFCNVVDEARVATGGKYPIDPYIIPTAAMNAFALQDFQRRAVIGITDGLLKRLNRSQLEAVIGHEAGHIASGDCLETTVTTVVFKAFDTICDMSRRMLFYSDGGRSRRDGGNIVVVVLAVFVIALVLKGIGYLASMFISREREYRADALSVRMTRNPLALAEALTIISNRWRGSGMPGENMEAIFILNPRQNAVDDGEDLFSNLFSTHPPITQRIGILLDMAHADAGDLKKALDVAKARETVSGEIDKAPGRMPGPAIPLPIPVPSPLAFPVTMGATGLPAAKDLCPRCQVPLMPKTYEGCVIKSCGICSGSLVAELDVLNIVSRREQVFDERIQSLARLTREQVKPMKSNPFDRIYDERSIVCPSCLDTQKRMTRRFISAQYPVEIDKCKTCARVWFDKDELEVLQCLYEATTPEPGTAVVR